MPDVSPKEGLRRLDDDDLVARMRAMSLGERLESGFELCEFAFELVGYRRSRTSRPCRQAKRAPRSTWPSWSEPANPRFETRCGQLDLLLAHHWHERYGELRAAAVRAGAAGIEITIAGLEDLIRLKSAIGRDRDLLDIGDLLAIDPGSMPGSGG